MKKTRSLKFLVCLTIVTCFPTAGSFASPQERVVELLESIIAPDEPGAAVLVMKGGEVIVSETIGLADMEHRVAITERTSFRLGSVTKQFTAVAILKLVEAGKIDLDGKVTDYLPQLPEHFGKIAIRHLLSHTSGLVDLFTKRGIYSLIHLEVTPADLIGLIQDDPLMFEPGDQWTYSNTNYALLGWIIEMVSGEPYGQFIEEHVFRHLGMVDSHFDYNLKVIPNRARGYILDGDTWLNNEYLNASNAYAHGGLTSSITDLAKWHLAIRSKTLLRADLLALAFQKTPLNNGEEADYGMGWKLRNYLGVDTIEHDGSIAAFETTVIHVPSLDVYVAVLTNNIAATNSTMLARRIVGDMASKPFPIFHEIEQSVFDPAKIRGTYSLGEEETVQIGIHDGQLYSKHSNGSWREAIPAQEGYFYNRYSLSYFQLVANEAEGEPIKVEYFNRDQSSMTGHKISDSVEDWLDPQPLDSKIAESLVGSYDIGGGWKVRISTADGRLFVKIPDRAKEELFAINKYSYQDFPGGLHYDFTPEANEVSHLAISAGGYTFLTGSKVGSQ